MYYCNSAIEVPWPQVTNLSFFYFLGDRQVFEKNHYKVRKSNVHIISKSNELSARTKFNNYCHVSHMFFRPTQS